MVGQETLHVGRAQRHQEIVTVTTPCPGVAICEKPVADMSRTRPGLLPSRSSTTHVVDAPVAAATTRTVVPKGSVGLAQVPGEASGYQVASPLRVAGGVAAGGVAAGGVAAGGVAAGAGGVAA